MEVTSVERKRLKEVLPGIAMPLSKASEPKRERGVIMWLGQSRFGLAFFVFFEHQKLLAIECLNE